MWCSAAALGSSGQLRQSAVLLQAGVDLGLIVRLRLRCNSAGHPGEAGEGAPAPAVLQAAKLLSAVRDIEAALPQEVRNGSVIKVASVQEGQLELLCLKALAAKAYKALMPLQARLGLHLGEVKACISFKPLCPSELSDAMAIAVRKALCHLGSAPTASAATAGAGAAAGADAAPVWHSLDNHTLISSSNLQAAPGEVVTARRVEWEVVVQQPSTLVLMVTKAGAIKFRPFSIAHALAASLSTSRSRLPAPLNPEDDDVAIVGDPIKLRAADRALRDAAPLCKLLPDQMPAVVRGIRASAGAQDASIRATWLGMHAITLPEHVPFFLEVSPSDDPDAASELVPSSCVLTPMGMTDAPPSAPEHMSGAAAVQLLAGQLVGSGMTLWGPGGLKLLDASAAGSAQTSKHPAAEGTPVHVDTRQATAAAPAASIYQLTSGWQSARAVLGSSAADSGGIGSSSRGGSAPAAPPAGQQLSGSVKGVAQQQPLLMANLVPVGPEGVTEQGAGVGSEAGHGSIAGAGAGGCGARAGVKATKVDYSGLRQQLERLARERQELVGASGSNGSRATSAAPGAAGAQQLVAVGADRRGGAAGTSNAAVTLHKPTFGRRPGAPPAAIAKKATSGPSVFKAVAAVAASVAAGSAAVSASAPASTSAGGATSKPPSVPSFKKRPGAVATGAAAAKPPAAKKAKTAAAGSKAPGTGKAAAATGKAAAAAAGPSNAASPAVNATAPASAATAQQDLQAAAKPAAATSAAVSLAAAPPAAPAAAAGPSRKRTKAADLDSAAVEAKVLAKAATGQLRGLTAPEMQCFLRGRKLPVSGAKAVLEGRIRAALGMAVATVEAAAPRAAAAAAVD